MMKVDPDVNIISQESAYLIAKATELFIEVFAKRVNDVTVDSNRRSMQKKDVDYAINSEDRFCFLDGIELAPNCPDKKKVDRISKDDSNEI